MKCACGCGKESRKHSKYYKKACYARIYKQRAREKGPIDHRICKICEKEFPVYSYEPDKVICSYKCVGMGLGLSRKGVTARSKHSYEEVRRPEHIQTYCNQEWEQCKKYSGCQGKNYDGKCFVKPRRTDIYLHAINIEARF